MKMNPANISPSRVTALYNERDRLRAENERLRGNVETRDSQITTAMLMIQKLRSVLRGIQVLANEDIKDATEGCFTSQIEADARAALEDE